MNMVIDLDKLFDYAKRQVANAQGADEIEDVMDDLKRFLLISYSLKEDK